MHNYFNHHIRIIEYDSVKSYISAIVVIIDLSNSDIFKTNKKVRSWGRQTKEKAGFKLLSTYTISTHFEDLSPFDL